MAIAYDANTGGGANATWDYFVRFFNSGTLDMQVDGAGNLTMNGYIQAGTVTFAQLPSSCTLGQMLYVSDGRKAGEAAGAGSGVEVQCAALAKGAAAAWVPIVTATAVVAN